MSLVEGAAALFVVAGRAGGNQVAPGVLAAFAAWGYMVESEVAGAEAAVLTSVVVAQEDFATGEWDTAIWTAHHVLKADYRWALH